MFHPLPASGAAFFIHNQDAKANGMGMAAVSSIDNPSAVYYNPAMLVFQKGFSVSAGNMMASQRMRYKEPGTGKRFFTKATTHSIPHFYASYARGDYSFGIGIFSPFGLSNEWPADWPGRYETTFAEIKTTYVNPTFAYRVNDFFSFGVGISYVESSVTMKNILAVIPGVDGIAKLSGNGTGYGYNAGLTFLLPNDYTLSVTYRSNTRIRYRGNAVFYLPAPFATSSTGASTTFTLPFVAVAGLAKRIGDLTLEGDILFTGWSSMSSYTVSFDNGTGQFKYKNWCNTPSIALGADYRINDTFQVRGGYFFDKTPVPGKTLTPELPDSTRHIFTAGATYTNKGFKASLAYQATFFKDTQSYYPSFKGNYSSFANVVLISIGYSAH